MKHCCVFLFVCLCVYYFSVFLLISSFYDRDTYSVNVANRSVTIVTLLRLAEQRISELTLFGKQFQGRQNTHLYADLYIETSFVIVSVKCFDFLFCFDYRVCIFIDRSHKVLNQAHLFFITWKQ